MAKLAYQVKRLQKEAAPSPPACSRFMFSCCHVPDAPGVQTAQEGEQACWEERRFSLSQLVPLDKRGAFIHQDLSPDTRTSCSLSTTRLSYPRKILALLANLSLALLGHHSSNGAPKGCSYWYFTTNRKEWLFAKQDRACSSWVCISGIFPP